MIQAIINRMFVGSIVVKGWAAVIVLALLMVASTPVWARFAWLALFMAILFWVVDAHFTRQERLFRRAYEQVQKIAEADIDFSMDTKSVDTEASAWRNVFLSKALTLFYGSVIAAIGLVRSLGYFRG